MDGWPVFETEAAEWRFESETPTSRRARRRHSGPYLAAVAPAIADAVPRLPVALAAEVDDATAAIVRFDAAYGGALAPFAPLLLRSESTSSSRIEQLSATAEAIATAELGGRAGRSAEAIVANTTLMAHAIEEVDGLDESAILSLHRLLLESAHPEWVGHWRDQQVWIGGAHLGPHEADYVAPIAARVPAAIVDLLAFLDRDDLPVLVHAALAHAQFDGIHPFPDGNGRVGRALIHVLLRRAGLTRHSVLPLSAGLLADTDGYFAALEGYRAGDIEPIVSRFVEAAFAAVEHGERLAGEVRAIRDGWRTVIAARADSAVHPLLDLLVVAPVVDSALVQARLGVSAMTANAAIGTLEAAGVLVELTGQRRYRRWGAVEVLEALDRFAADLGRRGGGRGGRFG